MARDDPDFLEFFAAEFWPLRRTGFLLTGDWDQAEELAQEAMARTYAVWPRVRGYDRPAAYARKVLLNRHRSLLRRAVVEARHLVASRPEDRSQPDFAYRAVAADGLVENEVCPVYFAHLDGDPEPPPEPDPEEVAEWRWVPWASFRTLAATAPWALSPWSVEQVGQLPA